MTQQHKSLIFIIVVLICTFSLFAGDAFAQSRTKKKTKKKTTKTTQTTKGTSATPQVMSPTSNIPAPKLPVSPAINADPALYPPESAGKGNDEGQAVGNTEEKIFKVSEVTQKARILENPLPAYTEEAYKNQIKGVVRISVVLRAEGTVTNIKVIEGLPYGLNEKAIAAAKQIKFVPAQIDGKPVSQYVTLEYNFVPD